MVANIATESSLPSRSSSSTEVERAQPADLEGSAPRCPVGTFGGGVEHHHCAVDRGPGAVNVLAKILVVRRVQSTEMSRSLSTAVQSERTRRRSPRALTSPASWIARQTMAISRSRWSCRRRGARCSQIWAGPQSRRSGWSSIGCSCCRDGAVAHGVSPTAIERRDIKRSWSITTELGEIGPAWRIHFYWVTLLHISRPLHRSGSTTL